MRASCVRNLLTTSLIGFVLTTAAKPPGSSDRPIAEPRSRKLIRRRNSFSPKLGVFAVDFKPQLPSVVLHDVSVPSGVVVVALTPGPDTESRRFHAGDIIHTLNNTPMKSVEQLRSALHQLKAGDPVVLQVERQGKLHYVPFDME